MKRTAAIPGKPIVIKLREDEEALVMEWLNMQTLYSDSIRYLIQKEIAENGLKNLQLYVPQFRTIESLKTQMAQAVGTSTNVQNVQPPPDQSSETAPPTRNNPSLEQEIKVSSLVSQHMGSTLDQEDSNNDENIESATPPHSDSPRSSNGTNQESISPGTEGSHKRKAKKQFGSDVTNSFAN
ncbi:hypothetical protein [Paenibacillus ihuae]|uniref:hypothetical protein n=1 Tax=Paenibacillus ihuae TaxID=1232431 RepID=UPI0006D585B2|nr:hypothetical protein [Paenibacillus ihuae]